MRHWHGFPMDMGDLHKKGANSQALRSTHVSLFITKGEHLDAVPHGCIIQSRQLSNYYVGQLLYR